VILPAIPVRQAHLPSRRPVSCRLGRVTELSFHLGAAPVGPITADLTRPRWPAAP
jgi:hypothetical protein